QSSLRYTASFGVGVAFVICADAYEADAVMTTNKVMKETARKGRVKFVNALRNIYLQYTTALKCKDYRYTSSCAPYGTEVARDGFDLTNLASTVVEKTEVGFEFVALLEGFPLRIECCGTSLTDFGNRDHEFCWPGAWVWVG